MIVCLADVAHDVHRCPLVSRGGQLVHVTFYSCLSRPALRLVVEGPDPWVLLVDTETEFLVAAHAVFMDQPIMQSRR